jgi:hypothetical protein
MNMENYMVNWYNNSTWTTTVIHGREAVEEKRKYQPSFLKKFKAELQFFLVAEVFLRKQEEQFTVVYKTISQT